jgi:peptidyl-dipeptidase A
MSQFERLLYAEYLPTNQFNQKWWEIVKLYQGIVPPSERGEEYCDAATKTHIINDAGQYYDYALSFVLLFQLHEHIANNILHQDMHATNYYGNKEVGAFLQTLLKPGASRDWQDLLEESIGTREMSSQAMLNYFEPLMVFLKKENEGRVHTLEMNW